MTITRVRITHSYDIFKGRIGYIIDRIDQHSLVTYVVTFKGQCKGFKRAYQRNEIKFLKPVELPKSISQIL
jgi:hypothetical protein